MTRHAIVAGAGLAGLVAAVSLTEAGWDVSLLEREHQPGGTTVLSSGWIWRYRDLSTFTWAAPHAEHELRELIWYGLPPALAWLRKLGVRIIAPGTSNPLTDGVRIDPAQAVAKLVERLPDGVLCTRRELRDLRRCASGTGIEAVVARGDRDGTELLAADAVILAGGGFAANQVDLRLAMDVTSDAASRWFIRNARSSDGTTQNAAEQLGGLRTPTRGETFARPMLDGVAINAGDFVRYSQVYGRHAIVVGSRGHVLPHESHDWADVRLSQRIAREPGPTWFVLSREALGAPTPYGLVRGAVNDAIAAGADVVEARGDDLISALVERGLSYTAALPEQLIEAVCAVPVRAGITHTIDGLRIGPDARVVTAIGERLPLFAAGVDAGGISDGGYSSGLAQALVLAWRASETIVKQSMALTR